MLTTKQNITIDGESVVNGVKIQTFRAVINSADPTNLRFTTLRNDEAAYKENRVETRADEAAFEDYVYSIQDTMLASEEPSEQVAE